MSGLETPVKKANAEQVVGGNLQIPRPCQLPGLATVGRHEQRATVTPVFGAVKPVGGPVLVRQQQTAAPINGQPVIENAVLGEGRHDEHVGGFPGIAGRLALVGQRGVVCVLAQIGKYLKNDKILGAAKRVADFVAKHAVPEAGGYKFPKAIPFKVDGQE